MKNEFDAINDSLEIEATAISKEIVSESSKLVKSPKEGDDESKYD